MMCLVDMVHVAPADRLHHAGHGIVALRRHQEVYVIAHQHIGVYIAAAIRRSALQAIQIKEIVLVIKETRLPVVSTLDDVLRDAEEIESG